MIFDTNIRINDVIALCHDQICKYHILVLGQDNKERVVPVSFYMGKQLMWNMLVRDVFFGDHALKYGNLFPTKRGQLLTSVDVGKIPKLAAREVSASENIHNGDIAARSQKTSSLINL